MALLMAVAVCSDTSSLAQSCYPTDPDGVNPDNLCLRYPPFPQDATIIRGSGRVADYSEFGAYPPNQNPAMKTNGFWRGIDVNGNSNTIRIKDSMGRTKTFQP